MSPQCPLAPRLPPQGTSRFTEEFEVASEPKSVNTDDMDGMVSIDLGPPSYWETQLKQNEKTRAEKEESKRKQCRRARKQQIIILIIAAAFIGGMVPLVVLAFKKNQ